MTDVRIREFDLTAGQTLTVDCQRISAEPWTWTGRAEGSTMYVESAYVEEPGADDWFSITSVSPGHPERCPVPHPVAWMRWRCYIGGSGKISLAFRGRVIPTVE